uniref:Uncharacterized protein n=1 Tax=Arundo donax TaxID=35708 RepID=A0A0A8Y9E5_ARUDO
MRWRRPVRRPRRTSRRRGGRVRERGRGRVASRLVSMRMMTWGHSSAGRPPGSSHALLIASP